MQRGTTAMTEINLLPSDQQDDLGRVIGERKHKRPLRADLTEAEKAEALRIGRIEFKSAGAVRKR